VKNIYFSRRIDKVLALGLKLWRWN